MNTKFKLLFLIFTLTFSFAMASNLSDDNSQEKALRHVVILKFKDSSTSEQIQEVENAFRKLPSQIEEIIDFEWGTNNSPEGQAQGFTHVFFVTFASEEDRDVYLPHPAHEAFVKVLEPHMDKVLVIDYWAKD